MSGSDDDWRSSAFIGLGLAGMGIGGALAAASATMGPPAIAVWGIAMVIVTAVARSPVAKALAERIRQPASETTGEVATAMYGELDELRARVVELEERTDFAERLLTRQSQDGGSA